MTDQSRATATRDLEGILEELRTETADLDKKIAASQARAQQAKTAQEEAAKNLERALTRLRSVER